MFKKFQKIVLRYNYSSGIYIWMEGQMIILFQFLINKNMNMIFLIIDKAEWRYGAGFQSKVPSEPLIRRKGKLSLSESLFEIPDVELAEMFKYNKVMPVAFMITEEYVFALS